MEDNKKRKYMYIAGPLVLLIALVGITYAFFNYTRTGVSNTIKVGKISFSSNQTDTIILTNVFPISSSEATGENTNYDEVVISITGDTTYNEGIEYLITTTNVSNTINNKQIPISIEVIPSSGLGNNDLNYFDNRGGNDSINKVLAKDTIEENGEILVGYIAKGATGVNGTVTIKAYIDKDKIAISDTYPSGNVTHTESSGEASIEVVDYTNGTTSEWVNGRVVLTTSEWNSLQNSSLSFKVRVEANEGIWVEDPRGFKKLEKAVIAKQNAETNSCNPIWTDPKDGIVYFSGTNECVDMNYVWYSGKLWRITAIYPDGAMKLITQNNITTIAFNESGQANFYTDANTTSYMYQWLNEDFYDTLYNASEFIDTTKKWNATQVISYIDTRPAETNMITANVGILNSYEYYNSYRCVSGVACTGTNYSYRTGYLNIGYDWRLLNAYNGAMEMWYVARGGNASKCGSTTQNGVRPSIYLKSGIEFSGEGTTASPYKILGDKDVGQANDLINTRLSGEYVKLDNGTTNQTFRIIGVEDNNTKIIAMDYAENKNTRMFATNSSDTLWGSGTTTDTDTWYEYLNRQTTGYLDILKSTYGELFDSGIYYYGTSGINYKLSVCANTTSGNTKVCTKTSQSGTFNIGLPRYGEMFATQQAGGYSNSVSMLLMNRYDVSYVQRVNTYGVIAVGDPAAFPARPTVHLKSTVKILSGTGTETDPYVVGL